MSTTDPYASYMQAIQPHKDRLLAGDRHPEPNQPRDIGGVFITRERLIEACASHAVGGTLEMLEQQGGGPEDLADAILEALGREPAA